MSGARGNELPTQTAASKGLSGAIGLIEPPHDPTQSGRLAEAGPGTVDHRAG